MEVELMKVRVRGVHDGTIHPIYGRLKGGAEIEIPRCEVIPMLFEAIEPVAVKEITVAPVAAEQAAPDKESEVIGNANNKRNRG